MSTQKSDNQPIIIAIIGAIASIFAALIGSNFFTETRVNKEIAELSFKETATLELRAVNAPPRTEIKDGFISVLARAAPNPNHRLVVARGYINGELFQSAYAHDATVPGVDSILEASFVMPVPSGATWEVRADPNDVSNIVVKWFSQETQLIREEK